MNDSSILNKFIISQLLSLKNLSFNFIFFHFTVQILESDGGSAAGGVVFLISSGSPFPLSEYDLNQLQQLVVPRQVQVVPVLYPMTARSPTPDQGVDKLAQLTGQGTDQGTWLSDRTQGPGLVNGPGDLAQWTDQGTWLTERTRGLIQWTDQGTWFSERTRGPSSVQGTWLTEQTRGPGSVNWPGDLAKCTDQGTWLSERTRGPGSVNGPGDLTQWTDPGTWISYFLLR